MVNSSVQKRVMGLVQKGDEQVAEARDLLRRANKGGIILPQQEAELANYEKKLDQYKLAFEEEEV